MAGEMPWIIPVEAFPYIWKEAFPSNLALGTIYHDLSVIVMTIKSECSRGVLWQNLSFVGKHIDPLIHRLLELRIKKEEIDETNFLNDECCRLGALILLAKIRRRFKDIRPAFEGVVSMPELISILKRHYEDWTTFKSSILWLLIMGAMETENAEEKLWICQQLPRAARMMELKTWDEVYVISSNMLWVGDVLDAEFEQLRPLVLMD